MNKRLKEFYKMRNGLPVDAIQFVRQDVDFLSKLSQEEFEFLLEWEYNNAMDNYSEVRRDVMNPKRVYNYYPEKPKTEDGKTIAGSHEFDSIPSTFEILPKTDAEIIYAIWIRTISDEDFLKAISEQWDIGTFEISHSELMSKAEQFLKKVDKRTYDKNRWANK